MSISLADWKGVPAPSATLLDGRFIRLERLDPARHGDDLFQVLQGPGADPVLWNYLPYGPFPERAAFDAWLSGHAAASDPYFFTVIDRASGQAQGIISLMSIVPAQGRIEIGHVTFGSPM
ncbi:GNAT family N-acetyltransferase, partial [Pseudomonas protegens]|nr:GNAT family N-acetyltransferase [Pseudomonas protegens]